MAHFLLSMLLLGMAVVLHWRTGEGDGAPATARAPTGAAARLRVLAVVGLTLVAGTVVTGSDPTPATRRRPEPASTPNPSASCMPTSSCCLSVFPWRCGSPLRAVGGPSRAAGTLVIVVLSQGAVGWTQYFTGLPVALVGVHMAGACLVLIAAVRVLLSLRERQSVAAVDVPWQSAKLAGGVSPALLWWTRICHHGGHAHVAR